MLCMRTLFAASTCVASCFLLFPWSLPAESETRSIDPWNEDHVLFYTIRTTGRDRDVRNYIAQLLSTFHADFLELSNMKSEDFDACSVTINLHPPGDEQWQLGYASMVGGVQNDADGRGQRGYVGDINLPGRAAHDGSAVSTSHHPMDHNYFDKLVIHEIAPVYIEMYARAHGGRFHASPAWFVQGLEEYFGICHSTQYWKDTGVGYYYRLVCKSHGVDADFGLNVCDVYNDGFIVVKFIADEFGQETLLRILASDMPTFGARLREAVGVEYDEFLTRLSAWLDALPTD